MLKSEDHLGEGKGYPLQYSGLENAMDCIVHGVAKSQTQLCDFKKKNYVLWLVTMDCSPPGSSVHGDSPGKTTGGDCHALLQGSQPRDQTQVSHIAGGFLTV